VPGESYTAEGATEVAATMRAAAAQLGDLGTVNRQVADLVGGRARQIVPVLTGALRASIVGAGEAQTAEVSSGLVYSPVIHNGWPRHNISPSPFIRDAFDETADQWDALYAKAVQEAADHVHGI
jgi:hypothetical protein